MVRKRLTITLRKELLRALDEYIDGERIRNRSHAIEFLLSQILGSRIKKAVILAGGKGIKMRPLTYELPKPMIPVKGRPILEYIIDLLREYEIRDIIILIGSLGEKIKQHFSDGSKLGVKITYLREKEKAGTGGALRSIKEHLKTPFLLIYGDVLADINLRDFIAFHQSNKRALISLALTSVEDPTAFGMVRLRGSQVVEFVEKPQKAQSLSRLVSAGIYIIEPEVLKLIPPKGFTMLEQDVLPKLVKKKRVYGYPFEGQWFDVSTPEIYERVIKEWRK